MVMGRREPPANTFTVDELALGTSIEVGTWNSLPLLKLSAPMGHLLNRDLFFLVQGMSAERGLRSIMKSGIVH